MPAKSKAASTPKFPWDDLSANTLRNVCRDIGCRVLLTKPNMITFLEDVEENGGTNYIISLSFLDSGW
jgi:hypothetical protein